MPKLVDHAAYRQELLAKSFPLFAERGYGAITMRQLAAGLGVSTGTLYYYFPSKQAIFEQMVLIRVSQSLDMFGDRLAALPSVADKIQLIFAYYGEAEESVLQEVMLYVDFFQYQQQQDGENILAQVYDRIKLGIVEFLGIADEDLVQLLVSVIDGLLIARIYGRRPNWQRQGEFFSQLVAQQQASVSSSA